MRGCLLVTGGRFCLRFCLHKLSLPCGASSRIKQLCEYLSVLKVLSGEHTPPALGTDWLRDRKADRSAGGGPSDAPPQSPSPIHHHPAPGSSSTFLSPSSARPPAATQPPSSFLFEWSLRTTFNPLDRNTEQKRSALLVLVRSFWRSGPGVIGQMC